MNYHGFWHFAHMGGYAYYVWPAFALSLILLGYNLWQAWYRYRQILRQLRQPRQPRESQRAPHS